MTETATLPPAIPLDAVIDCAKRMSLPAHKWALWAADCAEHVLHLYEASYPEDNRPRLAIAAAREGSNTTHAAYAAARAAYAAANAAAYAAARAAYAAANAAANAAYAAAYAARAARAARATHAAARAARAARATHAAAGAAADAARDAADAARAAADAARDAAAEQLWQATQLMHYMSREGE